jgi:S1-C subfamily serine protease
MGPGNSHEDEPLDEQPEGSVPGSHEGSDDEPDDGADIGRSGTRGPLPDPLDRVWLHPTELSSLGPAFAPSGTEPPRESRRRGRSWLVPLLAGAAGALLTVAVLAVAGAFDRSSPADGSAVLAGDVATTVGTPSVSETLARLSPSVVAVFARDSRGSRRGSGVCVRHGTQLLTSARVVGDAGTVRVVTADGHNHTATVVGRDRVTDLVLLDLQDDANLPAAQLADDPPAPGAPVWLLGAGAPGAKSPWMSSGMTSSNDALVVSDLGPTTSGLLETDAASNTAVVGGGLVNASGSVAGIVLGHVNGSSTTYAVPIDTAVNIAHQLDATGVARHGWLGIGGTDTMYGPMIASMKTDAPAATAGLRVNDLLQTVDGRTVESIGDVTALVQGLDPGRTVAIGVRRGDETLEMQVKLGAKAG